MKIKIVFSLLLGLNMSLSTPQLLYAQDWAPIGATWYFSPPSDFELGIDCGSEYCSYTKIESIRDTIVSNQAARLLKFTTTNNIDSSIYYEIMYGDSDKVYHYDEGQFYTLYDFSVQAGQTVVIRNSPFVNYYTNDTTKKIPSFVVFIDSVGTINIDNQSLKVVYVSPVNSWWGIGGSIIERLGAIDGRGMLFGYNQGLLPDVPWARFEFRCYEDPLMNYHPIPTANCDTFITTVGIQDGEKTIMDMKIYPNPAANEQMTLQLEAPYYKELQFELYNLKGTLQVTSTLPAYQTQLNVNVSNLSEGLYIFIIRDEKTIKGRSKVTILR